MQTMTRFAIAYAVNSVWQLPLLLLAAEIVARVLGRTHGRVLCRLWHTALMLALVCPTLSFIPASVREVSPASPALPTAQSQSPATGNQAAASGRGPVHFGFLDLQAENPGEIDRALSKPPGTVSIFILYLYLCSVIVAAMRLARGLWVTRLLMRSTRAAEFHEALETAWTAAQAAMGITKVKLLSTAKLSSPATLYWPEPIVLTPSKLPGAGATEMRAVFCHELAHVIRRDFLWNLAAETAGVLLFYHPAFHWMRRRIRETRELACDDLAAEALRGRRKYARNLLSYTQKMLSSAVVPQPASALGIFEGAVLERRIMNLLGERSRLPMLRTVVSRNSRGRSCHRHRCSEHTLWHEAGPCSIGSTDEWCSKRLVHGRK